MVAVCAVDVDAVVAPETEEVGPAAVVGPDRHLIVEVHDAHGPGVILEDCNNSSGCAIVDLRVEVVAQEVDDTCAGSIEEVA